MKFPVSFRLSSTVLRLIARLALVLGMSKTGVVEQAVRALAKREGLDK